MAPESETQVAEQRPPNGWREVELHTVADVRFSSVDKLLYPSEQPVRLCNYIDVYKNEYITGDLAFMRASATQPEIDRFRLQVGDVIITKDSETPDDIGVPAVVDYAAPDLLCGYHLGVIRPDKRDVDPTFLTKQLGHHRIASYYGRQANGLTRYGLPIGAVERTLLWLPDSEEQRAIGNVFRLVDSAIAATGSVIAKIEHVHAGLLRDLLTRGLDEDGHLRDPIVHPEQFQHSSMGRIPSQWEIFELADRCYSYAGGTPSRGNSTFFGGEIPWVKSAEVNQDEITTTEESLTTEGFHASSAKWIPAGTPLIAMYGATAGQVSWLAVDATANQAVLAVVPKNAGTCARYVFWFLRFVAPRLVALATGSGQPNLSKIIVERFALTFPRKVEEQERIASILDEVAMQHIAEQKVLQKLRSLRSGLIADLLTGHVRMPASLYFVETPG